MISEHPYVLQNIGLQTLELAISLYIVWNCRTLDFIPWNGFTLQALHSLSGSVQKWWFFLWCLGTQNMCM